MSKAKHILIVIALFALFIAMECTEEQPLTITTRGSIVGVVKPLGVIAQVRIYQGIFLDSTFTDSTSGFFKIDSLEVGFYTLEVIASGYGKYIENRIEVVSGGITSVGEIPLRPIPEQVLALFPSNGTSNLKLTEPCGFIFSTLMDHGSVESSFKITPATEGYFRWQENGKNSTFYFYPDPKYRPYTTYSFSLSTSAHTIYGDSISFKISSSFITEPVKVIAHTPEDGANYVLPNSSIFIQFNVSMDRGSVENAFNIYEDTAGKFLWHNNESFSFIPNLYLATNTLYTVTISTNARDIYGNPASPFTTSFTTEPLSVKQTYPINGATNISRNTAIQIIFNTNLDQQATESAFSILPDVSGVFSWTDLTKFSFFPETNLAADTWYTVRVNTNCKDSYGKNLPADYVFTFKTKNE